MDEEDLKCEDCQLFKRLSKLEDLRSEHAKEYEKMTLDNYNESQKFLDKLSSDVFYSGARTGFVIGVVIGCALTILCLIPYLMR